MDLVIETHELTKRYDGFTAVDALELEVRAGEIFGFLGPNGAGKSTTILMLLGLTEASGGSVRVLGYDPARQPIEVKRRVGYMPENLGFYGDLTGRENLEYVAELNDIPRDEARRRIDAALEKVRMAGEDRADTGDTENAGADPAPLSAGRGKKWDCFPWTAPRPPFDDAD